MTMGRSTDSSHPRSPQLPGHHDSALNLRHTNTHFTKDLELDSRDANDEMEHLEMSPDQLRVENDAIRSKLNQLTAEVAHMKNFVLKDAIRPQADGGDSK